MRPHDHSRCPNQGAHERRASGRRRGPGSACPCGTRRRTSRNSGTFYGQDGKGTPYSEFVSVDARVRIVAGLPAGTTELGCHRGLLDGVPGYGAGRMVEAGALCDARVRPALAEHSVTLRSFVPPLTG